MSAVEGGSFWDPYIAGRTLIRSWSTGPRNGPASQSDRSLCLRGLCVNASFLREIAPLGRVILPHA